MAQGYLSNLTTATNNMTQMNTNMTQISKIAGDMLSAVNNAGASP